MDNMPYVNAALLCEVVLEAKDNTLSAIRLIDKMEYEIQTNVAELAKIPLKPVVNVAGLICLRSGPAVGNFTLQIDFVTPSQKRKRAASIPFELKGNEHAHNFKMNMLVGVEEDGWHWFEVLVNENLLTKMPLMLVRKEPSAQLVPTPGAEQSKDQ